MQEIRAEIDEMRETSAALYKRGASDGLPVIPPTEERVEEMLRGTDRSRDEELARLGNREGILTVENVAINGVLAGCTPIHMPMLLAGSRAFADPEANAIQVSTSTGSWSYFWLANGPVRQELDLDHHFAHRHSPNRVIARALGLIYKNTALVHPGEKDMGVQGSPFKYNFLIAENEEANPWAPVHETRGFDPEASTLTIGGPNSIAQYSTDAEDPEDILKRMIYNAPPALERVGYSSSVWGTHGLCPADANTLSDAGFSKSEVKSYLLQNTNTISYKQHTGINMEDESDEIDDLRPSHTDELNQLCLPVIGEGRGENVMIGPSLPGLVTKPIVYPENWESLLDEYAGKRTGLDDDWIVTP